MLLDFKQRISNFMAVYLPIHHNVSVLLRQKERKTERNIESRKERKKKEQKNEKSSRIIK